MVHCKTWTGNAITRILTGPGMDAWKVVEAEWEDMTIPLTAVRKLACFSPPADATPEEMKAAGAVPGELLVTTLHARSLQFSKR